jgi:hypothetical protein
MEDSLLRGYSMYCPKYTKLKEQHRQDDDWIQLMKEKKEFLKTVQTNAGISYELDPYNIYTVSDPLFCEVSCISGCLKPGDGSVNFVIFLSVVATWVELA